MRLDWLPGLSSGWKKPGNLEERLKPFYLPNRSLCKELCVLSTAQVGRSLISVPGLAADSCPAESLWSRGALSPFIHLSMRKKAQGCQICHSSARKSWALPGTEAQSTRAPWLWEETGCLTLRDRQWQSSQLCFKNLDSCALKSGFGKSFSVQGFSFIFQLADSIILTSKVLSAFYHLHFRQNFSQSRKSALILSQALLPFSPPLWVSTY